MKGFTPLGHFKIFFYSSHLKFYNFFLFNEPYYTKNRHKSWVSSIEWDRFKSKHIYKACWYGVDMLLHILPAVHTMFELLPAKLNYQCLTKKVNQIYRNFIQTQKYTKCHINTILIQFMWQIFMGWCYP